MSTTPTPTPNEVFAAGWVAALKAWALLHNDDALSAYNNAVNAGATPANPQMWVVDAQLVYSVFTGTDPNYSDLGKVFQLVQYVPPPPPPPVIPAVQIQLSLPGPIPGTYEASGDGPEIPVGATTTESGHSYKKIQVGTEPMGPIFAWQQIS